MERIYKSEEEFLNDYNPDEFEKLSMTADILIFSVSNEESTNYRKTDKKKMSILLVKRNNYPFKDMWCLPGGFVDIKEDLDVAPIRILKNETNLDDIYLEQLYTFGSVNRDPRMRVVSTSYIALIDKNRLINNLTDNASWFDIIFYEDKNNIVDITLCNGEVTIKFKIKKVLREKTTDRYSFEILEKQNKLTAYTETIDKLNKDQEKESSALIEIDNRLTVIKKINTFVKRDFRGYLLKNIITYLENKSKEYLSYIHKDINAFNDLMSSYRLKKDTLEEKEYRSKVIQENVMKALIVPYSLALDLYSILDDIKYCYYHSNKNIQSDALMAMIIARCVILSCLCNVYINLNSLKDESVKEDINNKCIEMKNRVNELEKELINNSPYFNI